VIFDNSVKLTDLRFGPFEELILEDMDSESLFEQFSARTKPLLKYCTNKMKHMLNVMREEQEAEGESGEEDEPSGGEESDIESAEINDNDMENGFSDGSQELEYSIGSSGEDEVGSEEEESDVNEASEGDDDSEDEEAMMERFLDDQEEMEEKRIRKEEEGMQGKSSDRHKGAIEDDYDEEEDDLDYTQRVLYESESMKMDGANIHFDDFFIRPKSRPGQKKMSAREKKRVAFMAKKDEERLVGERTAHGKAKEKETTKKNKDKRTNMDGEGASAESESSSVDQSNDSASSSESDDDEPASDSDSDAGFFDGVTVDEDGEELAEIVGSDESGRSEEEMEDATEGEETEGEDDEEDEQLIGSEGDKDDDDDYDSGDSEGENSQSESQLVSNAELDPKMAQIRALEDNLKNPRSWELQGEVNATSRPENSLLELHVDSERASKSAPIITKEVTSSLEDMIIERIKKHQFDDVVPSTKPVPVTRDDGEVHVSQEKSREGLGEVYAQEFLAKSLNLPKTDPKRDKELEETVLLFQKVCKKLDGLSHFHYTPKPVLEDGTISSSSGAPALSLEDATPAVEGLASTVAPEEIKEKKKRLGDDSELGRTEKQAMRRTQKKGKKRKLAASASGRNDEDDNGKISDKRVSQGQLSTSGHSSNKSSVFFSNLADSAAQVAKDALEAKGDKKKETAKPRSSSASFKL
jgi:U3 small nucleolar RNA-associated protein MPP10